jgi:5-methylcytosine-specific restriction endonuclease McrA
LAGTDVFLSSGKYINEVLYLFGNQLWILTKEEKMANEEELRLIFLEFVDKERQKYEKLRRKFSGEAGAKIESRREKIQEEVRIFVWRRDEGRCVECSSQERLEFDHIIPFSKGGSNTTRNIQLLCEVCNRKKSNNI